MQVFLAICIGIFFLFVLIACAAKMAVREELHKFKEEIIKEFNLKPIDKDSRNDG